MHSERAPVKEASIATVGGGSLLLHEPAFAKGVYVVECVDKDGNILWTDTIDNVVTTVGKNAALDAYLAGSSYTVTGPFMGLVSSVSYSAGSTPTISSLTSYTGNVVTLAMSGAHNILPGDTFTLASVTGTGTNVGVLSNTWVATTGTTGSTLVFSIGCSGLTITTVTGGNFSTPAGMRIGDTMSSHGNWTEAGNANVPTYTAPRKTCAWSAASSGSKALSAALSFAITSAGTIKGCFIVFGSGAVSTIDNTSGTLYSAGLFTGGDKVVGNGDTLNVSYTTSI